MQRYYADLHIHSRYSRATSPACTPEGLCHWAQLKGITVCGTGDCTHPLWFKELSEKLAEDSPGLYTLKPTYYEQAVQAIPANCRSKTRFMITGEISSIYKRDGRCRKIHNIIVMSSLDTAERLNRQLAQRGNIHSDGRPILGLDPRDLLTLLLESDPRAALIPAHIWTPWFALLGAKSGFDSITAGFGKLASHIFAVETGLSSDAPMNHRIRALDHVALVANSDLHSPQNLGRNANIFWGQPDYDTLLNGLRNRDPRICGGTVHLFPEEGKYYLDGHRACGVSLSPEAGMACNNICPVCQKPLTMGVLHRVLELESQQTPQCRKTDPLPQRLPYHNIIPLPELLAQQLGKSVASQAVTTQYQQILAQAGPELPLLLDSADNTLNALGKIGENILQVRNGQVKREGGYDGKYGKVCVL